MPMLEGVRAEALPPEPGPPGRPPAVSRIGEPPARLHGGDLEASGSGSGRTPEDFKLGLDVLRGLADQELSKAEASRSRSRQAFAFAAGFFAVVQTVSFGAFVSSRVASAHHTGTLINHATYAGISLAICGVALIIADLFWPSRDLTPEMVWSTLRSESADEPLAEEFAHDYAMVVAARRHTNRSRGYAVTVTTSFALLTIGLTIWELLVSLHAGG